MIASRWPTSPSLLRPLALAVLCLVAAAPAPARLAPYPDDGTGGSAWEIDRRSHPVVTRAWDAIEHGRWSDPGLAGIPSLEGAQVLHDGGDWTLLWLSPRQSEELEAAGVRLSRPRPRPPADAQTAVEMERTDLLPMTALQSLSKALSVDTMMAGLGRISVDIRTRYYRTPGMQMATQYAFDRLSAAGCDNVYFDNFTYNGYAIRNVIGVKTGATYPARIYMVCGHLDSTSPQRDTLAPGAEDNGSGAIGVLEAARLLAGIPTDATIYFVCFTAEEQGLIGSEHLASIADQENWDLRGVLNMDMVGYDTSGDPSLWIEGFHANAGSVALMDLLESVANTYTDLEVYRYPGDGWGSDHEPFNAHGFPAILAIDYNWDSYPCYHQTCDVIENISPSQFRRMVVAVTVAGAQLAGLRTTLGGIDGTADRTDSDDDAGIRLEIPGTQYAPVQSGPGGTFAIPDLLPGTYTLRASAVGYETVDTRVTVVDGAFTHVAIHLDPTVGGEVRGVVTLQGGGIPLNARIFVEGRSEVAYATMTGSYDLAPVPAGTVVISANYPNRMPGARVVDVPSGQIVPDVDFNLEANWTFEGESEGFAANAGWQWGTDSQSGAHSGTKVWGTKLGANYDTCADYRLDLIPLDLRFYTTARLHFWQWYKTETGHDGGNVQVSTDGGTTWSILTPVGGYPSQMSGACNVLAGQPGYSGTLTTWSEAIFDLASFTGRSIRLRFWFGADGATVNRGWYVDDFYLEGIQNTAGVSPDIAGPSFELNLQPNPFSSSVSIRFRNPAPANAWVTVFDAAGRRVREILSDAPLPAGDQRLAWDGRDGGGRPSPAGVYWVRVFTSGRTVISPVTLLK